MTMNNWRWVGNFSAGSRQLSHHQSRLSTIKSISSGFLWQLSWPRLHGEFNAVYFVKNEEPQQTDGARSDLTEQKRHSQNSKILNIWTNHFRSVYYRYCSMYIGWIYMWGITEMRKIESPSWYCSWGLQFLIYIFIFPYPLLKLFHHVLVIIP